MSHWRAIALGGFALLAGGLTSACREQVSPDPPVLVERNMYDQERYNPESYSRFFVDHASMRPPVEGTLAIEHYEPDDELATGILADGSGFVLAIPDEAVRRSGGPATMVERGKERFNIFCAPCHGLTGNGKGMVARSPAGFPPIPSLSDARVCQMPDGQLVTTIANGVRNMPSYAAQVPLGDRWAIVAYVRALELNQTAQGEGTK